jgi:hypothetical protein
MKETAVCIIDDSGKLVREQKVPTEPDDIVTLLISVGEDYGRVGIEAVFRRGERFWTPIEAFSRYLKELHELVSYTRPIKAANAMDD